VEDPMKRPIYGALAMLLALTGTAGAQGFPTAR
jgi:hypothetical protein